MHTPRFAIGFAIVAVAVALGGCVDDGPPAEPTSSATASPTPSATAPPVADELEFALPADCTAVLPDSRLAAFDGDGLTLIGGPGGKHEQYFAEPTPEENAGGITCVWGDDATDAAAIVVSVAPLGATRPEVVQSLLDQGLNEAIEGDLTLYAVQGDEEHAPAILNVLRPDSWISVIQTIGGAAKFDEAISVADEAAAIAYAPAG